MRLFFTWTLILSAWLGELSTYATERSPFEPIEGQEELRSELQKLLDPGALVSRKDFEQRFWFEGVLEEYWFLRSRDFPPDQIQSAYDIAARFAQIRWYLENKVWEFWSIAEEAFSVLEFTINRPYRSLEVWLPFFRSALIPILFGLLICFFAHLLAWLPAQRRDLQRFSLKLSLALIPIAWMSLILFSLLFGQLALACLIAASACLVYSRQKTLFAGVSFFLCLGLSSEVFFKSMERAASQNTLREALSLGRTQVELNPKAYEDLSSTERGILAFWNNQSSWAANHLQNASKTFEASILQEVLNFRPNEIEKSVSAFQSLVKQQPSHPIALFNLHQLYIREQQLVDADEINQKLGGSLMRQLTQRSEKTERFLLPPEGSSPSQAFFRLMKEELSYGKKTSVLEWLILFWQLIIPWIIFFTGFTFRKRGSGVCQHTGEATPSYRDDNSRLSVTVQQKTGEIDPGERQRYAQLSRTYHGLKAFRAKYFSLFFPFAFRAHEGRWFMASLSAALFCSLVFWALPGSLRYSLQIHFHPDLSWDFDYSTWCWSFVLLAFLLYIRSFLQCRKEFRQ